MSKKKFAIKDNLEEVIVDIILGMPEHVFVTFVITYCDQNNILLDDLIQKFYENKNKD